MKKTIIYAVAFVFLCGAMNVAAAEKDKNNKAPKATDIKIYKKQLISDEERKALDEAAKGRPAGKIPKTKTISSWATGELGAPLPEGGKKYAIVVGLANYSGIVNDLCVYSDDGDSSNDAATYLANPTVSDGLAYYCQDRDAYNMKTALVSRYGFAEENIIHLHDSQATRQGIEDAMDELKSKVGPNDEVVFFFSGHGTSGKLTSLKDKETIDEAVFTYDNNFIWDDEFKIWADSLDINRAVFAFDICKAGGMNDIAGDNRVVAMSSGETQSSWTYYLGGMYADGAIQMSEGLFTHYFAKEGMVGGLADGSNLISKEDNQVAVEEAFSYTYPIVKYKQTPVISDKFTNDLLLSF